MMRFAALLATLAVAATQSALAADPPAAPATSGHQTSAAQASAVAAPAADATPATATSASASAAAPAAHAAKPEDDAAQLERRMHAKGYTTRMESGEKVFCRREQVLGTRIGGALHCMHEDEARASLIQNDEEQLRQRMMMGCMPSHTMNGQAVANCGN